MSSKLQIYGSVESTCTQRAILAAIENGVEFDLKQVDLYAGEQKKAEYLKLQPFGQVPALVDGEFVLYESRAIARYIDAKCGQKLEPKDVKARAIMNQWLDVDMCSIAPELSHIAFERIFKAKWPGRGAADESIVQKAVEKLAKPLDVLDQHLSHNQWIAGAQFSLAEVAIAPYCAMVQKTPEGKKLFDSHKNITQWWHRVVERDSWKKLQKCIEEKCEEKKQHPQQQQQQQQQQQHPSKQQ